MKKTTRAKFRLIAVITDDGSMNVTGHPVANGSEENKTFNDATPGGNIHLHIAKDKEAQANFPVGEYKDFYLDIIPCEQDSVSAGSGEQ